MTLLDPSFTRQDFSFIEGKSKAKLTYGTMKPGASAHVELDLEPRKSFSLTLSKAQVIFDFPDEVSEKQELFTDGEAVNFGSAKDYYVKNIKYLQILIGIIVLAIFPILYSNSLKKKRVKLYKSH